MVGDDLACSTAANLCAVDGSRRVSLSIIFVMASISSCFSPACHFHTTREEHKF